MLIMVMRKGSEFKIFYVTQWMERFSFDLPQDANFFFGVGQGDEEVG